MQPCREVTFQESCLASVFWKSWKQNNRENLLAVFVNNTTGSLQRPRVSQVFDGITGTVMVGLGLRVAAES
jgi:hypothetical protein